MIAIETTPATPVRQATLFAFDDYAIPWRDNLKLTLAEAEKHPGNPVLCRGPEGSPDSGHTLIYGSVIEINGKFRIWYLGTWATEYDSGGQAPGWWRPMCYAESDDGIHWIKPNLGLVEFNGSCENNICLIEAHDPLLARVDDFLSVIHEPDDPDPSRRYKVAYIAHIPRNEFRGGVRDVALNEQMICAMVCATSADGIRWQVVGDRACVNEKFEVSGLYRFGEFYYATGQQVRPWAWTPEGEECGRIMTVYRSPDLACWSSARALGFARPGQLTRPRIAGQQTHMGAGMWNRGNVLVGLYGMWQDGPAEIPEGEAPLYGTRGDIGLVVSNDGIHFREPEPDFKVIPHGEDGEWDSIFVTQGHAFANVGDETYVWYGHWDCERKFRSQDIGLATLRRDGFGYLSLKESGMGGHFVTCILKADGPAILSVNVDGVSPEKPLTVELVDASDLPMPGFSGANAVLITEPGVRRPVNWTGCACLPPQRFAVRVTIAPGSDARVYGLYVEG